MRVVCALDVGTTRIKAMILGEDLVPQALASAPSVLNAPQPGFVEVDPEALWVQVLAVLREAAAARPDIAALAIANQRATVFLVDRHGKPLGPGMSWQDGRGDDELRTYLARVGEDRFVETTGLAPSTIWSLAKLLWWNERGLPQGARFATVQDLLQHRLGASDWVLDHSNASLAGLLDVGNLDWDVDLVRAAGLRVSQLPALASSGTRVGTIAPDVSAATGLPPDTALVLGGGDQQCATLGAGVGRPGLAALNLGTAGVVDVPTDRPSIDRAKRLVCLAHVVPGRWLLEGLESTYGGAHYWARKLLGEDPQILGAEAPVGSKKLLFFPYLAGSGAPDYDSAARGAFLGLTLAHGRAEVARAVLEGSTVELARIVQVARELAPVDLLIATGGGARSSLLLEMLAGLTGLPVAAAKQAETTLLGAGILAWIGLGRWPDADTAAAALPSAEAVAAPEPALAAAYRSLFGRYENALARLKRSGLLWPTEGIEGLRDD